MIDRSPPDTADSRAGRVTIVVALAAEARPLIDAFGLRDGTRSGGLRRLQNDDGTVRLIVGGVGKIAAARAVALAAGGSHSAWLNVGVAGHRDHAVGSGVVGHKIVDVESGRAWYPPGIFDPEFPSGTVCTVDGPCDDYRGDNFYDMEAAGFYATAARHASHELVQCFKVVSDNRLQPSAALTAARVEELIGANVSAARHAVRRLMALARQTAAAAREPAAFADVVALCHFTTSERRRLRSLLRRWEITFPGRDPARLPDATLAGSGIGARRILETLDVELGRAVLRLPTVR